jgi:hypothetical protein
MAAFCATTPFTVRVSGNHIIINQNGKSVKLCPYTSATLLQQLWAAAQKGAM